MKKLLAILLCVTLIACTGCTSSQTPQPPTPPVTVHTVTVDGVAQRVVDGQCAALRAPTRQGFNFAGWEADGVAFDPATPITGDVTLTAQWTPSIVTPEPEVIEARLSVTADTEATSVWTAAYSETGIAFEIDVTDPCIVTASGDKGMNDNVELVLTAVPTEKYDTRYTFNFLCGADGRFWFRRAKNGTEFGEDCAYDTFVRLGENLIYEWTLTQTGYRINVFFAYGLLNTSFGEAYGKIAFIPAMRNTDNLRTEFKWFGDYGSTWGKPSTFLVVKEDHTLARPEPKPIDINGAFEASALYDGRRLTDHLAHVEGTEDGSYVAELNVGVNVFTDRMYGLDRNAVCEELLGKSFLYDSIEGARGTVTEAGYVVLLAPENNYPELHYELEQKGWVRIASDPRMILSIPPGNGAIVETSCYYVKWCEEGELIFFRKYFIAIFETAQDNYVDVSQTEPATFLTDFTGYELFTRHWQGVTTMERTAGGRLYASWVTGGDNEPRLSNYNVVVYSDDDGATWHDLWVIKHDSYSVKINDAQLWIDPDGVLWVFYTQSFAVETFTPETGGQSFDKHAGVWAVKVTEPDAEVITHSEPFRVFDGLLRNKPLVLSDGTWLAAPNDYVDETNTIVFASTDKGASWTVRGGAYIPQAYNFDETVLYEQVDGTLRVMVRTSVGTIWQAFSYDKGYTWTDAESSGIINPCSRFQMFRMPSGNVILINNNHASWRDNMTVYLSEDDGKTWSYQMLLDARTVTTYPDYAIDRETGEIWVIWDWSRTDQGNICMTRFTESDVKAYNLLPSERIITVSAPSHVNDGETEGDTLGSANGLTATGGFDATLDTGDAPSVTQKQYGSHAIYHKSAPATDVSFETDVLAGSIINRDGYPKYGITLTSGTHELFFYLDAENWMQNYEAGYVMRSLTGDWDWDHSIVVPASFDYDEVNKLAVVKQGAKLRFLLNGNAIMEADGLTGFGASDAVTAGLRTFNFRARYSNYSLTTDAAVVAQKATQINAVDTLFVGHSGLSLYSFANFFELFPEDCVNVAIYGSVTDYWLGHVTDQIAIYNPKRIVLAISGNDINRGDSVDKAYGEVTSLIDKIHAALPDTVIYYVENMPSVRWWNLEGKFVEMRAKMNAYAQDKSYMAVVHAADVGCYTTDGTFVRSQLYVDRLHFNRAGYVLFADVIKQTIFDKEGVQV